MDLKFVKCTFCSNIITLSMSIEDLDFLKKFLNSCVKIKESSHSIGIYDSSANRVLMMCSSCSRISFKLKQVNNIRNREITGKKEQKKYSFSEEDLKIFNKELKNILKEKTCTIIE